MVAKCDAVLAEMQKFARKNPKFSADVFKRNGISIFSRKSFFRDLIEITHGKLSGDFVLRQKSQGQRTAYLWMQKIKGTTKWKFADFSHKSKGLFDQGIPGQVYEFKARYINVKGKSEFTNIVEIICL